MIKSRALAKLKAMKHQLVSLKHDETNPLVFDMSDAGTGKTFVRIMGFAKRRAKGGGPLLVLAPRSLLRVAWEADLKKFAPHLTVSVATADVREKAFNADVDVYVANHDAVKWLAKQKPAFLRKFDGGEVVIDESTAFKHHTSQRSKAAGKVMKRFERRACLTATPTSNGILDIWHQVHLLDGGRRLGPSYYGFRNTVCQPKQVARNDKAIQWSDKEGAEEAVFSLLEDIVIRHQRKDCVDIPPTHTHTLGYDMTPRQRRMYDKMEQDQLLPLLGSLTDQVTAALTGKQHKIIAINAAAVITKLLQIASGAVYDGTGGYSVIDDSRYELLLDLAEMRKHPLMFFFWKHQRDLLTAEAEKRGMSFAVIDASTSDAERFAIVSKYQLGLYDVLFAHPQSAAHGLTLTKGTTTIWPGPTYNLEWFVQGSQRQARIGQKEKTEIVTVIANDTRETEIYDEILMPKNTRMSNLLKLAALGTADRELEAA